MSKYKFLLFVLGFCWLFLSFGCSSTSDIKGAVDVAHINVKLGLLYLQQGYVAIAKSKMLLACKQAPYDAKVHAATGYFFSHTGESKMAEKHYLYAIKLAREKGEFWHDYGKFLYQYGSNKSALKYFLLAAKDINYLYVADAYADASFSARKLKHDDLAKKLYAEAVRHGYILNNKAV